MGWKRAGEVREDRVTVSAGGSDVLPGFIEKRRSFIDDYYPPARSGIQFRESSGRANNSRLSPSRYSSSSCAPRPHFHALPAISIPSNFDSGVLRIWCFLPQRFPSVTEFLERNV